MITQQRFEWLPLSELQPLPFAADASPLDLKLIIIGDRLSLEELEFAEPELFECALYGEYESLMFLKMSSSSLYG